MVMSRHEYESRDAARLLDLARAAMGRRSGCFSSDIAIIYRC